MPIGPYRFVKMPLSIMSSDLSPAAKLVFAAILNRIGKNSKCWPGQRTIASDCGITLPTVHRCVLELSDRKLIQIHPGRMDGPKSERSNRYEILNVTPFERSKSGTFKKLNSNVQKMERQRLKNGTELDSENYTQGTRPICTPSGVPSKSFLDEPEPEQESKLKRTRATTPLEDAVRQTWFADGVTKRQGSRFGRIHSELRELSATPETLQERIRAYVAKFPDCPCTPEALLKHWGSLGLENAFRQIPAVLNGPLIGESEARAAEEKKAAEEQAATIKIIEAMSDDELKLYKDRAISRADWRLAEQFLKANPRKHLVLMAKIVEAKRVDEESERRTALTFSARPTADECPF